MRAMTMHAGLSSRHNGSKLGVPGRIFYLNVFIPRSGQIESFAVSKLAKRREYYYCPGKSTEEPKTALSGRLKRTGPGVNLD